MNGLPGVWDWPCWSDQLCETLSSSLHPIEHSFPQASSPLTAADEQSPPLSRMQMFAVLQLTKSEKNNNKKNVWFLSLILIFVSRTDRMYTNGWFEQLNNLFGASDTVQESHKELISIISLVTITIADGQCIKDLTWIWTAATITLKCCLFSPECHVFFEEGQKGERRKKEKQSKDRKEKNNFPLKIAEWLCVGELGVHTKMKRNWHSFEILQSKLTFYLSILSHCQSKAEERGERGSKREVEKRGEKGERRRQCCS